MRVAHAGRYAKFWLDPVEFSGGWFGLSVHAPIEPGRVTGAKGTVSPAFHGNNMKSPHLLRAGAKRSKAQGQPCKCFRRAGEK